MTAAPANQAAKSKGFAAFEEGASLWGRIAHELPRQAARKRSLAVVEPSVSRR